MALKWAAFNDRGSRDPFSSHDLEDILALLASRPTIVAEVNDAPESIRSFVSDRSRMLLDLGDFDDLIAAHLNNAQGASRVIQRVRQTLLLLTGDAAAIEPGSSASFD
jgi:hypothetical protein